MPVIWAYKYSTRCSVLASIYTILYKWLYWRLAAGKTAVTYELAN